MYKQEFFIQTSTNTGAIRHGLLQTAKSGRFDSLTAAVAYATKPGCQLLIDDFDKHVLNWRILKKEWLISFDFGITEPEGLKFLQSLPNSTVKIPDAEKVLEAKLRPSKRFHSKLYLFQGRGAVPYAFFSGSANLTPSGLIKNSEQGISQIWKHRLKDADRTHLKALESQKAFLRDEFNSATPLTDVLLKTYAFIRTRKKSDYYDDDPKFVAKLSNPNLGLSVSKAAALESASSFWVEIKSVVRNLGVGRAGNQIDLRRGSRLFFGFDAQDVAPNTQLGNVRVRYRGEIAECHMRFGDNGMDKLTLPIPAVHGIPTYENSTLLFRKNHDEIFDLCLGSAVEVRQWKATSSHNDTHYEMRGGRQFGVY